MSEEVSTARGPGSRKGSAVSLTGGETAAEKQQQQQPAAAAATQPQETEWDRQIMEKAKLEEPPESFIEVVKSDESKNYVSQTEWKEMNIPDQLYMNLIKNEFFRPSRIQAVALPMILTSTTHMVAQAKNGTGKTATFILSSICKIDVNILRPQVILLSPSKELAHQNLMVFEKLAEGMNFTTMLGCPPIMEPIVTAQFISATPGKMMNWTGRDMLPLGDVKLFILDEADVLVDGTLPNSLGSQTWKIAKSLTRSAPNVQVLLFSATFPERVQSFAKLMAPKANRLIMKTEELKLTSICQFYLKIANTQEAKIRTLTSMYQSLVINQSIIFVRSRQDAVNVAKAVRQFGCEVGLLYGSGAMADDADKMSLEERDRVMEEFREGVIKCLVTTDLLARGIDIPQVSLVVNYDLPMTMSQNRDVFDPVTERHVAMETYLHRVGRTGRFGSRGVAINFVCNESEVRYIKTIEDYYQIKIQEIGQDFDALEQMVRQLRSVKV